MGYGAYFLFIFIQTPLGVPQRGEIGKQTQQLVWMGLTFGSKPNFEFTFFPKRGLIEII